jgi:hypothetical protein
MTRSSAGASTSYGNRHLGPILCFFRKYFRKKLAKMAILTQNAITPSASPPPQPPVLQIIIFSSTTLFTGMTGISLLGAM